MEGPKPMLTEFAIHHELESCEIVSRGFVKGGSKGGLRSPSIIGKNKTKCLFYIHTIKVCVNVFGRCPGTFPASMVHLMVSLFLCSSRSDIQGKSRALCQLKKPSKVRDGDEGVGGRNRRK